MNSADFYDLFGPTKVGWKGYHALVGHRSLLVFDEPRRLGGKQAHGKLIDTKLIKHYGY